MIEHRTVKTFHARRGRMSPSRKYILENILPKFVISEPNAPADLHDEMGFNRLIVDFGCGMGDATLALLKNHPDDLVLAIDVHTPGICRIAEHADNHDLSNLRIHHGDGIDVLSHWLKPESVNTLYVLFPDPWPKVRHHKRRLIQEHFLQVAHRVIADGGQLVIATDDASYADHIIEVISDSKLFLESDSTVEIPITGFARRADRLGNAVRTFHLVRV